MFIFFSCAPVRAATGNKTSAHEQLLPGQALRAVHHSANHTCRAGSLSFSWTGQDTMLDQLSTTFAFCGYVVLFQCVLQRALCAFQFLLRQILSRNVWARNDCNSRGRTRGRNWDKSLYELSSLLFTDTSNNGFYFPLPWSKVVWN